MPILFKVPLPSVLPYCLVILSSVKNKTFYGNYAYKRLENINDKKCINIKFKNSNIYRKKLLYINDHIKTRININVESFLK